MNKQGIIQQFSSATLAIDAGFETIAKTRRKEAGKASRRDKSRAARKARRLQRNR